jgi:hypothetical protein
MHARSLSPRPSALLQTRPSPKSATQSLAEVRPTSDDRERMVRWLHDLSSS